MKNPKVLFSTLVGAIIIAVVLKYGPIKELVYGEGWPRILIGVVLLPGGFRLYFTRSTKITKLPQRICCLCGCL